MLSTVTEPSSATPSGDQRRDSARTRFSARLLTHLRAPLYRNSYSLVLSAGGTAILGLVYWTVAARFYPTHEVGLQSVIVSTMLFLAGLSQLSLNSVLLRYLPIAGRRSGRLVAVAYGASALAAILAASVFVVGTPVWSANLTFLGNNPIWFVAFVGGTTTWCVFTLQDSVLTGLRRTGWVPVENIAVSVAKIGLLFALKSQLPNAGLFASWVIPTVLAIGLVNLLVYRRFMPVLTAIRSELPSRRAIARFAGGNYVGFAFYAAATNLVPLIVLNRAGATEAAYYFLPWTITSALLAVPASTATSLTVEAVRNRASLLLYSRRTLIHTFALVVGPVAVLSLGASPLLRLFGSNYADHGATTLRLLALGVFPTTIVAIGLSVLRVRGLVIQLAMLQAIVCLLVLGLSYVLLPRYGIAGVGVSYDLSQCAGAAILLGGVLRPTLGRSGASTS